MARFQNFFLWNNLGRWYVWGSTKVREIQVNIEVRQFNHSNYCLQVAFETKPQQIPKQHHSLLYWLVMTTLDFRNHRNDICHCGLVESVRSLAETGWELASWLCRKNIMFHVYIAYNYLGSIWVLWVHMASYKNCVEKKFSSIRIIWLTQSCTSSYLTDFKESESSEWLEVILIVWLIARCLKHLLISRSNNHLTDFMVLVSFTFSLGTYGFIQKLCWKKNFNLARVLLHTGACANAVLLTYLLTYRYNHLIEFNTSESLIDLRHRNLHFPEIIFLDVSLASVRWCWHYFILMFLPHYIQSNDRKTHDTIN